MGIILCLFVLRYKCATKFKVCQKEYSRNLDKQKVSGVCCEVPGEPF